MGFEEGNEDGMGPGYREGTKAVDWMRWVCWFCLLFGRRGAGNGWGCRGWNEWSGIVFLVRGILVRRWIVRDL